MTFRMGIGVGAAMALVLATAGCTPDAQQALAGLTAAPDASVSEDELARRKAGLPTVQIPTAGGPSLPDKPAVDVDLDAPNPKLVVKKPIALGKRIPVDKARVVAQHYLAMNKAEPAWADATLDAKVPAAFMDGFEKEPASYEFLVLGPKGEPRGYMMVNTSPYVDPLPEYAFEGGGRAAMLSEEYLKDRGGAPKKPVFYRFSPVAYALEDAVNPEQVLTRSVGGYDFKAAKAGERQLMYMPGDEDRIAKRWQVLTTGEVPRKYTVQGKILSGKLRSVVPSYYQMPYKGCPVGCVPVAWAMVYGFYEQKGIDTIAGPAASNLNQYDKLGPGNWLSQPVDPDVWAMETALNRDMGTFCVPAGGATSASRMGDGRKWGQSRGLKVTASVSIWSLDATMFGILKTEIDADRPSVLAFVDQPNTQGVPHAVTTLGYRVETGFWDDVYTATVNFGWTPSYPITNLVEGTGELDLKGIAAITVTR